MFKGDVSTLGTQHRHGQAASQLGAEVVPVSPPQAPQDPGRVVLGEGAPCTLPLKLPAALLKLLSLPS